MLWNFIKGRMMQYCNQKLVDINKYSYTYHQVIDMVENLASNLIDEAYAILCSSELYTAIAILACFAAKKTAVPLSFGYGEHHFKNVLNEIQVPKVITENNNNYIIRSTNSSDYINNDKCMIILCTSGTTGKPKGVMLSEENIIENLASIDYGVNGNENVLIIRPTYHCGVLIGEFLYSLIKGFNVFFYNYSFMPMHICKIIKKYNISIMGATPTLLSMISEFLIKRNQRLNIKILKCSGECINEKASSIIREAFPDTLIYNFYGMTEACARVSCLLPTDFETHSTSVGKPVSGVSVKIVDDNGNEVKDNVPGELVVRGKNVMLGYYNNHTLTFEKIKDSWLYTGDIATKDYEGNIYIICRKDDMIIRSGLNIYPQEIENILKSDSRVADVLVYSIYDAFNRSRICMDIITDCLDVNKVFEICRTLLPKHLVPDRIRIVNEIPKNANGKKIRNAHKNKLGE